MNNNNLEPDYLFEVSWEVCNKVSGIHTVIATKVPTLVKELKDNYILIGPDLRRDTQIHNEFIEDENLLKTWKKKAHEEGLVLRVGRWNITGNPIVILVDFSTFVSHKNEIFKDYWETYQLDSLLGQWDYVEPALFGYAVGKVIESFYRYNSTVRDKIVAQFHEWLSGTGLLYIHSYLPQIATVFTTHATIVGRTLAAKHIPLYKDLEKYNGDLTAKELGFTPKQSLEKIAASSADCFTTVSKITARECVQFLGKNADTITPNGFEDDFIPEGDLFWEKRKEARQKFIQVAEALFGYQLSADIKIIATSGRYEFGNKGIDVFLDALGNLKNSEAIKIEILAFVLVSANNYGPKKGLLDRLENKEEKAELKGKYLTHSLHDSDDDLILNKIKSLDLNNNPEDKIKVVFVPSFLNGHDGVFNKSYYDLLIGLDLTVFASYYEPWGYMPLESLAFGVPTVTTSLAGFGKWIQDESIHLNTSSGIIERTDDNYDEVVKEVAERIIKCSQNSEEDSNKARENARQVSRAALWNNLIKYYREAYQLALKKVETRAESFAQIIRTEQEVSTRIYKSNKPVWKAINVHTNLPEIFKGLDELAYNLWWSWNYEAIELFEIVEPKIWLESGHNPVLLLQEVTYERLVELEKNKYFQEKFNYVYKKFKAYLAEKPAPDSPKIAYFSMEYGLVNTLKIFSGGLGVLAGDYLKEASDSKVDMTAIGFLYRYGYFKQQISLKGEQLATYEPQNFSHLPVRPVEDENGTWITTYIALPGRIVYARLWKVEVGRVKLYLMDANITDNSYEDREITHKLYGGDVEHRLKQEMLLGIGGIRALATLGIKPDLYHCNEGHAAFIGIERINKLMNEQNFTFAESLEIVRAASLFTTHTPVPAGHDTFTEDLMQIYMGKYPDRLKISWDELMNLGRSKPGDKTEKFSMSNLAANTCQEINGVSWLHGEVTKEMFMDIWDGYYPEELHIGYVTNGVHYGTWTNKEWRLLYEKEFGANFLTDQSNKNNWKAIYNVPDKNIWEIRQKLKKKLISHIKERLTSNWIQRYVDPKKIVRVRNAINENTLTIGFARRFATYKRAALLFKDIDRLAQIVSNPEMPVQFIFAGKAHPNDGGGQDLIRYIVEVSNRPEFIGKILFLQDYDMELAQVLVPGVDVWLNTPTRPMEASGTSGMKAVMNGVLNCSVLDGWWVEGYKANAGWALPMEQTYDNQDFQNELDSETLYGLLENEIIPAFYTRNEENIPEEWVKRIKHTIATIAPDFTTKRMIDDYKERFYNKLFERTKNLRLNDFELAKKISSWKKKVYRSWDSIEVVSVDFPDGDKESLMLGKNYPIEVVLDLKELSNTHVGVEILLTHKSADGKIHIVNITEMELTKVENQFAYYDTVLMPSKPGIFHYGLRIFPKNKDLPHRQDFSYVRWI